MAGLLVLVFVVSFLLGSIPWGLVISRLFFHTDIRSQGSGNIGTTNAMRVMGKKGGVAVFLLDFAKGVLSGVVALIVFRCLVDPTEADPLLTERLFTCLAFCACILGHIFSPWLRFKGGKGIAVAVGCMFVSFGPLGTLIELAVFVVLVVATRYVSVGSIASAALCPLLAIWMCWGEPVAWLLCAIPALVVVWAHRANIKRLLNHEELRIGDKKKAAAK